eukprot:gene6889-7584_t
MDLITKVEEHGLDFSLFQQANSRLYTPDPQKEETFEITQDSFIFGSHEPVGPENFKLLKVLGTGSFGKVILVQKERGPDSGRRYAMKVLKKAMIVREKKTEQHVESERHILEAIRQNRSKLHLVLDFVRGGELFTHLSRRRRFEEHEARFYIGEILLALQSLHNLGILYRDLKLENVLIDEHGHVVLTDFGLCKEHIDDHTSRTYSYVGTVEYMPPEIVSSDGHGHGRAVDWWSLGCMLYELTAGHTPFFDPKSDDNCADTISRRITKLPPPLPRWFSRNLKDIIRKLLQKIPDRRLGSGREDAEEIKIHPFFASLDWEKMYLKQIDPPFVPTIEHEDDFQNFDSEFLGMDVDSRDGEDSMSHPLFRNFSFVAPEVMFNTPLFPRAMTLDTNARQGIDDDVVDLKSPNPKAMSLSRNNGAVPCHQYLTETSKHELDKGDSQLSFAGHFSPARILANGAPIIIPDGDSSEASSYTSRNSQNYTHSQSSPQALSVSVYRREQDEQKELPSKRARLVTSLEPGEKLASEFKLGKKLGHGAFSRRGIRGISAEHEYEMLQRAQSHENIIAIHSAYRGECHCYIVMELATGGELLKFIHSRYSGYEPFTEKEARCLFRQVLSSLSHLHSRGIIHRDITASNFVLKSRQGAPVLKLVDFGFAIINQLPLQPTSTAEQSSEEHYCNEQSPLQNIPATAVLGSLENDFIKSESPNTDITSSDSQAVMVTSTTHDPSVDIWAAGCVLYQLLSGKSPFRGMRSDTGFSFQSLQKIVKRGVKFPETEWSQISAYAKDLVRTLMNPDPSQLPSANVALNHPWLAPVVQPGSDNHPLPSPSILRSIHGVSRNRRIQAT